jgi:hypothetical protein
MKYFPLVWSGLWRRPARSIFTLLSVVVAFSSLEGCRLIRLAALTTTATSYGYDHSALISERLCLGNSFLGRCGVELNLVVIGAQRGVGADS